MISVPRATPDTRPPLRLLCVGAGRDGSLSLTHMIRHLFEAEGAGRRVAHEYESRAFFEATVAMLERQDDTGRDAARELILNCPFDAIVGNGYASWLPLFAELCGPGLVLVHLRRRDREAGIRSLVENATFFPTAYGYYSTSPDAVSKRPAAFHYDEASKRAWNARPLEQKLAWHFDKTHALIDAHAHLFANRHDLATEDLNSPVSLELIGAIALGRPVAARAMHLNHHQQLANLPPDRRSKMQWLMGRFDLAEAARNEVYPLDHFINAFISWTGYQIRRSEQIGPEDYRSAAELDEMLKQAAKILDQGGHLVRLLKDELKDRRDALTEL